MIRFCDSEVGCAEYELLGRNRLLSYFLAGHLDEIVCVYDSFGTFMGIITYHSLLHSISVEAALNKEYVVLDDDLWRNARDIFKKRCNVRDLIPLPVLDKDYQLICFAYQDADANREIRMLRELRETEGALRFLDVFPQYKCVKIYGFNELAYFFVDYLKNQNIPVELESAMWRNFFPDEKCEVPEYECLNIYAEGTWEKPGNWKENLLRSVSVEFECVNKIYEENIKRGIVKNAISSCAELLERLKNENEIVILGTDMEAQDTYDFLLDNGIDVCCFTDNTSDENGHRMFKKAILNSADVIEKYQNPIFIDCISQYSTWGGGEIDNYDYLGYERNKQFIVLKDYIQIESECLVKALSGTKVILIGDIYLCKYLYSYLNKNMIAVEGYLDMENTSEHICVLPRVNINNIDREMMCLVVVPEYFTPRNMQAEIIRSIVAYLKENRIDNYSKYFSSAVPFIHIEGRRDKKYIKKELQPKRIILGSIESCCGNVFFRSLLDDHPSIMFTNYNHVNDTLINDNLFLLCIRLSIVSSDNILSAFWKIYEDEDRNEIENRALFDKKMRELLRGRSIFTPQELFVMFHVAYMYIKGKEILLTDIANMVIYWEPHFMDRALLEECWACFDSRIVFCDITNLVRNICMRNGAIAKGYISMGWLGDRETAYNAVLDYPQIGKKDYEIDNRLVIKFETLKCNPLEILMKICKRWGIAWSDSLMRTTNNGKSTVYDNGEKAVKDFDLEPVYNTYEKYFSEFDRLRLMIINAPWQRKYGYPYERVSRFSRKDLQEMFIQEFRFEEMITYNGTESDFVMSYRRQIVVRNRLRKLRLLEFLEENSDKMQMS